MYFINKANDVVVECLEGSVVHLDSNLAMLDTKGDNTVKVVVRKDWAKDKVALISGGGSGHEPAHAGFVGRGMLTAAVCGEVFASPPISAVLAAIRAVAGEAGVLLIVKNYTGDRLNFGLACEQARAAGIKCEMVVVADDVALEPKKGQVGEGRRGIAGTVLVHKIAGYAADCGEDLAEVARVAQEVARNVGTIGVSCDTCHVFGSARSERIPKDSFELGLGIHGEPGRSTIKAVNTNELVQRMVDQIYDEKTEYIEPLGENETVIALVNNLGASTPLELGIVAKELIKVMKGRVSLLLSGHFMTSLNMPGFSISLLRATQEYTTALMANTEAPGWVRGSLVSGKPSLIPAPCGDELILKERAAHLSNSSLRIESALVGAARALIKAEVELNNLDRIIGDGDCGSTMALAGRTILENIKSIPVQSLKATASWLGNKAQTLGGTSGALYAFFWLGIATELPDEDHCSLSVASKAFEKGIERMMFFGGGKLGDRTMLDALVPAYEALRVNSSSKVAVALGEMVGAARKGALDTLHMKAVVGRAAYVPEEKLRECADPGANAVVLWMSAVAENLFLKI